MLVRATCVDAAETGRGFAQVQDPSAASQCGNGLLTQETVTFKMTVSTSGPVYKDCLTSAMAMGMGARSAYPLVPGIDTFHKEVSERLPKDLTYGCGHHLFFLSLLLA